jgi:hypothetical protein
MPEINPYVGEFVRGASPFRSGEAFRPLNGGRGGQNPHTLRLTTRNPNLEPLIFHLRFLRLSQKPIRITKE